MTSNINMTSPWSLIARKNSSTLIFFYSAFLSPRGLSFQPVPFAHSFRVRVSRGQSGVQEVVADLETAIQNNDQLHKNVEFHQFPTRRKSSSCCLSRTCCKRRPRSSSRTETTFCGRTVPSASSSCTKKFCKVNPLSRCASSFAKKLIGAGGFRLSAGPASRRCTAIVAPHDHQDEDAATEIEEDIDEVNEDHENSREKKGCGLVQERRDTKKQRVHPRPNNGWTRSRPTTAVCTMRGSRERHPSRGLAFLEFDEEKDLETRQHGGWKEKEHIHNYLNKDEIQKHHQAQKGGHRRRRPTQEIKVPAVVAVPRRDEVVVKEQKNKTLAMSPSSKANSCSVTNEKMKEAEVAILEELKRFEIALRKLLDTDSMLGGGVEKTKMLCGMFDFEDEYPRKLTSRIASAAAEEANPFLSVAWSVTDEEDRRLYLVVVARMGLTNFMNPQAHGTAYDLGGAPETAEDVERHAQTLFENDYNPMVFRHDLLAALPTILRGFEAAASVVPRATATPQKVDKGQSPSNGEKDSPCCCCQLLEPTSTSAGTTKPEKRSSAAFYPPNDDFDIDDILNSSECVLPNKAVVELDEKKKPVISTPSPASVSTAEPDTPCSSTDETTLRLQERPRSLLEESRELDDVVEDEDQDSCNNMNEQEGARPDEAVVDPAWYIFSHRQLTLLEQLLKALAVWSFTEESISDAVRDWYSRSPMMGRASVEVEVDKNCFGIGSTPGASNTNANALLLKRVSNIASQIVNREEPYGEDPLSFLDVAFPSHLEEEQEFVN
ncbi:unnamed protein product [Amoebophrya sp. A25]|nr:unnamed protein product [Amoebophrya sp. A25]|eukprot:GSA25T00007109001.1